MKKNIQIAGLFSFLFSILIFSSCSDILDVNAFSKITNEGIEDSDQGADMWVMGAYNGLSRMYVYDEFPRCLELDNAASGSSKIYKPFPRKRFNASEIKPSPCDC